jgi:two-component system nitrogen regulation sensor histidine kinase NtrY
MRHELKVICLAFLGGVPGSLIALYFLWSGAYSSRVQWTASLLIVIVWVGASLAVRRHVVYPLQTLSNLLAALREGDYSVRGSSARNDDSLGEVTREINALGDTLRWQRMGALEATALLQKVMEEIDVAILSFDADRKLRLVNRAGEQLLGQGWEQLLGADAEDLGLLEYLSGETPRLTEFTFPGGVGRWEIRRTSFRQEGIPHQLLVLSDLGRTLREEERRAWQRIVRVLGHELNNSLTPISSISGSLTSLLGRDHRPVDWEDDLRHGLSIISSRSASLGRFIESYSKLARLPKPSPESVDVGSLLNRIVELETRLEVQLEDGSPITIHADRGQLEQLLINLIRNAVEAALETGGKVNAHWTQEGSIVEIRIRDEGPGFTNTSNLFVPFFTTKQGGSGIGLVLSRQIAEAHHGSLTLKNRHDGPGCEACLRLPIDGTATGNLQELPTPGASAKARRASIRN